MVCSKFNLLSSSVLNLVAITGNDCYRKGLLALQNGNDKKAFDLFSQGYGKFHGPCVRELGKMYKNGHYVETDTVKAMYFFKRGAYNYEDQACNFLVGELYCNENENELNLEEIKILDHINSLDMSIESILQWLIGDMYRLGLGHEKNFDQSLHWYNCALETHQSSEMSSDDSFCRYVYLSMGKIYEERGQDEVQNYSLALHYFEKAAEQNCVEACDKIGNFYKNGLGVDVNYEKAFQWYFRAATSEQDDIQPYTAGQFHLGIMYKDGLGTKVDNDSAMFWFKKATYGGNKEAFDYVEQMHQISIMEIRKKNFIDREKQLLSLKFASEEKTEIPTTKAEVDFNITEDKLNILMSQYFEKWEGIGGEHKNQIECNK